MCGTYVCNGLTVKRRVGGGGAEAHDTPPLEKTTQWLKDRYRSIRVKQSTMYLPYLYPNASRIDAQPDVRRVNILIWHSTGHKVAVEVEGIASSWV